MSTGPSTRWRPILVLLAGFALWSAIAVYALPLYARAVVPAAQWILDRTQPHGVRIRFTGAYPQTTWQAGDQALDARGERTSFRLIAYNLVLYLAALTALPRLPLKQRLLLLLTGLPLLFLFHVLDLLLVVESRTLSLLVPQPRLRLTPFDLWFVAVKFSHSFSVLAMKQAVPLLLLLLQWYGLEKLTDRRE